MENNDNQAVDLENNEQSVEGSQDDSQVTPPEPSAREKELEAEVSKYKRIAERNAKKAEKGESNTEEKVSDSSKPDDLDYGEKAYLRSAIDLKGADELQLAKEFKSKYGMSVEEMEADSVFNAKLQGLREARESQAAIPKGSKRSGQSGVTDVDLAVAKYKESGELPKDYDTRLKVINAISASQQSSGMFSGPSVV